MQLICWQSLINPQHRAGPLHGFPGVAGILRLGQQQIFLEGLRERSRAHAYVFHRVPPSAPFHFYGLLASVLRISTIGRQDTDRGN